ncbi:H(+)-transporting V1 sector ATPase subunit F [Balamuthia mandrillaris]
MATRSRMRQREGGSLLSIIGDEDTVTGFLLAGVGDVNQKRSTNFLVVDNKTKLSQIEETFKQFTSREDVAILLITQDVANDIRHLLDDYDQLFPTILEIPSKNTPYDVTKDSLMTRVKRLTGSDAS